MKTRKSTAIAAALGGVAAAGAGADPADAMLPADAGGGGTPAKEKPPAQNQQGGGQPVRHEAPPPRQPAPAPTTTPAVTKPKVLPGGEQQQGQVPVRTEPRHERGRGTPPPDQTPAINPAVNKPKMLPGGEQQGQVPGRTEPQPEPDPLTPAQRRLREDARGYADTLDQIEADGYAMRMGTANALQRYGEDPRAVKRGQRIAQRRDAAEERDRKAEEERQERLDDGSIEPMEDPGQFTLEREGFDEDSRRNLREMQQRYPKVELDDVIADGNHPTGGLNDEDKGLREVFADSPVESLENEDVDGYSWEDSGDFSDNDVQRMVPQGITGQNGTHAISWYGQPGGDGPKSSGRISFVNGDEDSYRHVLLVEPTEGGGFDQVQTHAGGIAWKGDHMYVADTHGGFDVFDTSQMMEVPGDLDQDATDGYKYLLPKIGSYSSNGSKLRFSTASIDESQPGGPALVVGEYRNDDDPETRGNSRIVRWGMDPETGLLTQEDASAAYETTKDQIQGAAMHDGRFYLSSSDPANSGGALYTGHADGQPVDERDWGDSPESLYVEDGRLWSLSEHHHDRTVFNVPLDNYDD